MFRQNWKALSFWRWWWRTRVSTSAKHITALAAAAVLLVGGYFASNWLAGASAANDSLNTYVVQTTVQKVITVREHGRTIVKRVPVVVRRTIVKSRTATAYNTVVDTRVVTTPGGTKYVVKKVTHLVPVVHNKVVRVNGKTTTLTETRLVSTVKTETQVVTNQQTVTNQSTVVVNQTDTVTLPAVTNFVTDTTTTTVQLPPNTVTLTDTVITTVTLSVPVTTTIFVST
jgi:hypothetical protein